MPRKLRHLTLAEHQRLGELLYQAQCCVREAYQLATQSYPLADLRQLEKLMRSGSVIDQIKNRLDEHFWSEVGGGWLPEPPKNAHVYYGVDQRCPAWAGAPPHPRGANRMTYAITYEHGPTSVGASVPALPGCIAVAPTYEQVRVLIREAIALHLAGMQEDEETP